MEDYFDLIDRVAILAAVQMTGMNYVYNSQNQMIPRAAIVKYLQQENREIHLI